MLTDLITVFGGTGAVLLGIGGLVRKCLQSYQIRWVRGSCIDNAPTETLPNTWDHANGKTIEHPFKRMVYATKQGNAWRIQLKQGEGSVYVYVDKFQAPPNKMRFLRVRLKGVPKKAKITFLQKYWGGTSKKYIQSESPPPKPTPIKAVDGIHTYCDPSLIGVDDVKKEQLGLHFNTSETGYDCIIEEAYMKEPTSIWNVVCCGRKVGTLLYAKKKASDA